MDAILWVLFEAIVVRDFEVKDFFFIMIIDRGRFRLSFKVYILIF